MKTKHIKKALILFAGISLFGCAKDKVADDVKADYQINEVWVNDELQSVWHYDEGNRLASTTTYSGKKVVGITHYSYNETDLVTEVKTEYGAGETSVETFIYDSQGKLQKTWTKVNGAQQLTSNYTYSGNKVTITSSEAETEARVIQTFTFDDNGNLSEIYTDAGTVWVKSEFSQFDNRRAFQPAVAYPASVNNPGYEKQTFSSGEVEEWTYRYAYNEAGYTTSVERANKAGDKVKKTVYKLMKKG